MIHGTPRDANSLSPVPSAARPSRTARRMLFSFMGIGGSRRGSLNFYASPCETVNEGTATRLAGHP